MSENTIREKPFAWFQTDVNGKPVEFTHSESGAEAWREQGYILTPVYRAALASHETSESEGEPVAWGLLPLVQGTTHAYPTREAAEAAVKRIYINSTVVPLYPESALLTLSQKVKELTAERDQLLKTNEALRANWGYDLNTAKALLRSSQAREASLTQALEKAVLVFEGMMDDEIEVELLPSLRAALNGEPKEKVLSDTHRSAKVLARAARQQAGEAE